MLLEISNPEVNMDAVKLEKAPKIAVYSPKSAQPWDDAVTLVLTYAEIPYEVIYDDEIIDGNLHLYDWLHLHHEDFTGQYGRFYGSYRNHKWYQDQVAEFEETAARLGFTKVSELKLPNILSYSAKLFTTVGTNAGPCTVGPTIAAPIEPIPCGKNERSFSLVKTPGEIICSAILYIVYYVISLVGPV